MTKNAIQCFAEIIKYPYGAKEIDKDIKATITTDIYAPSYEPDLHLVDFMHQEAENFKNTFTPNEGTEFIIWCGRDFCKPDSSADDDKIRAFVADENKWRGKEYFYLEAQGTPLTDNLAELLVRQNIGAGETAAFYTAGKKDQLNTVKYDLFGEPFYTMFNFAHELGHSMQCGGNYYQKDTLGSTKKARVYREIHSNLTASAFMMTKAIQTGDAEVIEATKKQIMALASEMLQMTLRGEESLAYCDWRVTKQVLPYIIAGDYKKFINKDGNINWNAISDYAINKVNKYIYTDKEIADSYTETGPLVGKLWRECGENNEKFLARLAKVKGNNRVLNDLYEARTYFQNAGEIRDKITINRIYNKIDTRTRRTKNLVKWAESKTPATAEYVKLYKEKQDADKVKHFAEIIKYPYGIKEIDTDIRNTIAIEEYAPSYEDKIDLRGFLNRETKNFMRQNQNDDKDMFLVRCIRDLCDEYGQPAMHKINDRIFASPQWQTETWFKDYYGNGTMQEAATLINEYVKNRAGAGVGATMANKDESKLLHLGLYDILGEPFYTTFTFAHELTHLMQHKKDYHPYSAEGWEKSKSYTETHANLNAAAILMTKALQTGDDEVIAKTERKILANSALMTNSLLRTTPTLQYFDYKFTKAMLPVLKNGKYKELLNNNGDIDWNKTFAYTANILEKDMYTDEEIADIHHKTGKKIGELWKKYNKDMDVFLPELAKVKGDNRPLNDLYQTQSYYQNLGEEKTVTDLNRAYYNLASPQRIEEFMNDKQWANDPLTADYVKAYKLRQFKKEQYEKSASIKTSIPENKNVPANNKTAVLKNKGVER